ncbi:MAG: hypothetical protein QM733_10645 [Ilumatobacteraceae bacterium]
MRSATRSTSAARRSAASGARASIACSSSIRATASSVSAGSRLALGLGDQPAQAAVGIAGDGDRQHLGGRAVEYGVVGDGGERRGRGEVVVEPSSGGGEVVVERRERGRVVAALLLAAEADDRGTSQLEPGGTGIGRRIGGHRIAGRFVVGRRRECPPGGAAFSHWPVSRTGGRRRRRGRAR